MDHVERQPLMRVLLLEDDHVLASVLADFLRDEGHVVTHALDMQQADCLARGSGWDACIVDPGGGSFLELGAADSAQLRRLATHVPVVVTTGRAWARRTEPALLGVRAILAKPFDLGDLAQILDALARHALDGPGGE
jgi:DNA-binding response OmpR family regulator